MSRLSVTVTGTPGAQGSKRHVGNGVLVESSAKVKPWRQDVRAAVEQAMTAHDRWHSAALGPVSVAIVFRFRRPKSHYRTGRNAHLLRDAAPTHPTSRGLGDADKLARSTLDAIVSAGAIGDDSQVVSLRVHKVWGAPVGADVIVDTLEVAS